MQREVLSYRDSRFVVAHKLQWQKLHRVYSRMSCRWYVADGKADILEEASTSGRELRSDAARIGRPQELFGSSQRKKRPARHRVIMLRGVVGSLHALHSPTTSMNTMFSFFLWQLGA